MTQFWKQAIQIAAAGEPALFATVMSVHLQVPMTTKPGAHIIVMASEVLGSLDGGAIDAIAVPLLISDLDRDAFVMRFDVPAETATAHGLLHGGTIELIVHPLSALPAGMFETVASAIEGGETVAIVTPLHGDQGPRPGKPVLIGIGSGMDTDMESPIKAAVEQGIAAGKSFLSESGPDAAFIDVARPADHLVIFGTTVVAKALCRLAPGAGFRITLVDDTGLATPDGFPDAETIVHGDDPVETLACLPLPGPTFVVLMSVGHEHDNPSLMRMLPRPLRYLGMLGSRTRVANSVVKLQEAGFSPEEIARLHAPIGLDISSDTPYEIAVSILAQLIKVRNTSVASSI